MKKPSCSDCEYYFFNDKWCKVKTKKGMTNPGKSYCQHPKMKNRVISLRAVGIYGYPTWCPFADRRTCLECGTSIRIEEGEYCKKHR